ncbi:hypothetical protein ACWEQG_16515 [Microbispora sp. NPDC004025]
MDEVTRARTILAAIEERDERALGTERYAGFLEMLWQVTRDQRAWRQAPASTA